MDLSRCAFCERPTEPRACDRCGTVACRLHFDAELGFCLRCAERAKPTGRRGDTFLF